MLTILTTMRVHHHASHAESLDALDQRWYRLFLAASFRMILIPNQLEQAKYLIAHSEFDGVLLTGGNSLAKYQGDAPERDHVETYLIDHCIGHQKPLVGVCRGMQLLQDYFGIQLSPVENHVNQSHRLVVSDTESPRGALLNTLKQVNAYHAWGAYKGSNTFKTLATSEDGVIMAAEHESLPLFGQMWHPERNDPFILHELQILKAVFAHKNHVNHWEGPIA